MKEVVQRIPATGTQELNFESATDLPQTRRPPRPARRRRQRRARKNRQPAQDRPPSPRRRAPGRIQKFASSRLKASSTLIERPFALTDLDGNFIVITATDSPAVNAAVYAGALERNILCNSVDDIPNCDFFFGSVVSPRRSANRHLHRRRKPRLRPAPAPRNRRAASRKISAPGSPTSASSAARSSPLIPAAKSASSCCMSSPIAKSATRPPAPPASSRTRTPKLEPRAK